MEWFKDILSKHESLVSQALAKLKLTIVMFKFNHNGNGGLMIDITNVFRISKGIIDFYTNFFPWNDGCMLAKFIWKTNHQNKYWKLCWVFFQHLVKIIDGTFFIMVYKATKHGKYYHCKKMFYSISIMIVYGLIEKINHI